ncbi:DivIVA domain-containing protein [Actinomadura violacea]|uniref:Cell wall synthesis protein Wag31 n=1 Tax=Actinomadura violacea TaxID=2819934 RepID=A0ABS3S2W5_9ACTN|nr:DivIVA domain-containing protein [Actinomadura violacea]MBO2463327.1 DivIVA domain-containing protein [Actinomadura violacea]
MSEKRPAWQSRLTGFVRGPGGTGEERRLTPEAVRDRKFATTRLTQGYAVAEVDAFLDQVTHELARLIRERDEARAAARRPREDRLP